jgi:hypothetical protein
MRWRQRLYFQYTPHCSRRRKTIVGRDVLLVMATILRLPYTMAMAPYAQGGLLYGLLYYGQVSAYPRVL